MEGSKMKLCIALVLFAISAPTIMGQTLAEIIETDSEFSAFENALSQANILEILGDGSTNFTVFAPDEVVLTELEQAGVINFASLQTQQTLLFHIIPNLALTVEGIISLTAPTPFSTLFVDNGVPQQITIVNTGGDVIVQSVSIATTPDGSLVATSASNGVVYTLTSIAMPSQDTTPASPSDLSTVLDEFQEFPLSFSAFTVVGNLNTSLLESENITFFPPDTTAIGNYPGFIPFDQVVNYHIAAGAFSSGQFFDGQVLETTEGTELRVSIRNGAVFINQAKLESPFDISASNGFLHTIDKVLVPANALQVLNAAVMAGQEFSILIQALEAAGLDDDIETLVGYTLFAPDDNAFEELAEGMGVSVDELLNLPGLFDILAAHVVPQVEARSEDFESNVVFNTLEGDPIFVSSEGDAITVNTTASNANVILIADILSSNAIVHMIGSVAPPPSISQADMPPPPSSVPPAAPPLPSPGGATLASSPPTPAPDPNLTIDETDGVVSAFAPIWTPLLALVAVVLNSIVALVGK